MFHNIASNSLDEKYDYHITAITRLELKRDMSELWKCLAGHISFHCQNKSWTRIIFECWIERGQVIVYPSSLDTLYTVRRPVLDVKVDYLSLATQKSDEKETDDEKDVVSTIAYFDVMESITDSYRKEPAKSVIKNLLKQNDFKVITLRNGNISTKMEHGLFF